MNKKLILAFASLGILLSLTACAKTNSTSSKNSSESLSGSIIAGGSTALQPLAQQAADEFSAKNPKVQISVQGGGSGVGLTQVSAGSYQIGNSDIFAEEKTGIDESKITDYKVAVVGFAAVVNSKVNVDNLSTQQLVDIFTGKITNWSQVGGKDQKITVIGRTPGSGTRANFDKFALNNATEVTGPTQDASGSVVKLVGQTPGAISYLDFAHIEASQDIKALSLNGVKPTADNVKTNKWKVWSYEHMYTNNSKKNKAEKAFISYLAKDTTDIRKLGYIAVSDMKVDRSVDGTITKK